ncbi:unnamed protein product [Lymnaea stagnalis]|uniref:Uncharacterized protein n=1 Tax=Lymnaea stagnalis TaxID=6523 RepID=A0AAV2HKS3_LYMST
MPGHRRFYSATAGLSVYSVKEMASVSMRCYENFTAKHLTTPTMVFLVFLALIMCVQASMTPEQRHEAAFYAMARNRFAAATPEEHLYIWHHDCHRRCFHNLYEQIQIACDYDPYKTTTRAGRSVPGNNTRSVQGTSMTSSLSAPGPFLDRRPALAFLRTKRDTDESGHARPRRSQTIMNECCFMKACSWEEYSEYCHRHPRVPTNLVNSCSYS